MTDTAKSPWRLRSRDWFGNFERMDMTALNLERLMNYGITPEELRHGKPIIGIAQSGSDLSPCNGMHVELAKRVHYGIRDAGGSQPDTLLTGWFCSPDAPRSLRPIESRGQRAYRTASGVLRCCART